ncbi:MAG: tRNA preQ1(34) S-adenosylmethionine ribosyltransferase-isomerase QueA [Bacteroidota bacterium]|nr:tRNA preQ1(34) S-adenosylmethionine ribosyltransferase-isomerase QueA [Bacteroidota bacterium]
MKLSEFTFELPDELIASEPADYRDESRLMVVHRKTGEIEHKFFKDVVNYFDTGDVIILNDTKVFPARLYGKKEKTGAKIEVFLLRQLNKEQRLWDVLVDPARKIRVGNKLFFGEDDENDLLVAEVIDNTTSRGRTIRFLTDTTEDGFYDLLHQLGETPIPRYMNRKATEEDFNNYQTIYAKNKGAVAVPAAGLHFSREVMKWFEIKGVKIAEVTLHLGLGNLKKIEVEDLSKHKMESENYIIPVESVAIVNNAKLERKRICCVGNSTLRAIESSVSANNKLKAGEGWTEKFVFPPYDFHIQNCMITNFHAPKSTFFISTATFAGTENIKKAYEIAIAEKYRFLDYGDAMLII